MIHLDSYLWNGETYIRALDMSEPQPLLRIVETELPPELAEVPQRDWDILAEGIRMGLEAIPATPEPVVPAWWTCLMLFVCGFVAGAGLVAMMR